MPAPPSEHEDDNLLLLDSTESRCKETVSDSLAFFRRSDCHHSNELVGMFSGHRMRSTGICTSLVEKNRFFCVVIEGGFLVALGALEVVLCDFPQSIEQPEWLSFSLSYSIFHIHLFLLFDAGCILLHHSSKWAGG